MNEPAVGDRYEYRSASPWTDAEGPEGQHEHVTVSVVEVAAVGENHVDFDMVEVVSQEGVPPYYWARRPVDPGKHCLGVARRFLPDLVERGDLRPLPVTWPSATGKL